VKLKALSLVVDRTIDSLGLRTANKGQAAVEFTLVFILLVVIAWIPADFGLAFYTGQITQNAVREGARIAAADPTLAATNTTCGPPLSSCFGFGNVFNETAVRLPSAMLGPSTRITVSYPAAGSSTCNNLVSVSVRGQYPFFFYKLLRFMGITLTIPDIERSSIMRWEHQC
jgi:Flp pilus assembly protein TadG